MAFFYLSCLSQSSVCRSSQICLPKAPVSINFLMVGSSPRWALDACEYEPKKAYGSVCIITRFGSPRWFELYRVGLYYFISFHFPLLVLMIVFKGFVSHLKMNKTLDQIFLSLKNTHYLFTWFLICTRFYSNLLDTLLWDFVFYQFVPKIHFPVSK
jgi:hypothetical protein